MDGAAGESKTTKLLLLDSLLQERHTMLGRLARLGSPLTQQVRQHGHHHAGMDGAAGGVFQQCCGKCLPQYNPARAIPMKWGVVYMGVFMAFWGLCYTVSPFRERQHMTLSYSYEVGSGLHGSLHGILGPLLHCQSIPGEAMQAAGEIEEGGMMTVWAGADGELGRACLAAIEWCKQEQHLEWPVCQVANHLYCGAKVLGGHTLALQFIEENRKDFNIRRTARLPVSGAFHTSLMEPALEPFKTALLNTRVRDPRVPIYSNYDNKIVTRAEQLQRWLPRQMVLAVRWESSMASMFRSGPADLLPQVFECGPGRGLSAILGKVNGKAAKNCKFISC